MLLLEQDAKELLAIQGVPVPGGIRLAQAPKVPDAVEGSGSGPWIVKPQILAPTAGAHVVTARNSAEIAAAAAALLNTTIEGEVVHSVYVERQMTAQSEACLCFRCDPPTASIRIELSAGGGAPRSDVAAPDPGAVIACVNRLSTALPEAARTCVAAAGRMLAPLYFGYEAALMQIDPLLILPDGGWAVGDVKLAIDEYALFRHPELVSLVERRDFHYPEVRRLRAYGIDHRVLDPAGAVGTIAFGAGHCAYLLDELIARGLTPHNFMDAGPAAEGRLAEGLSAALGWLEEAAALRCVLIAASDGAVNLTDVAAGLAQALAARPAFAQPLVVRLAGTGAGAAGAILQQAYAPVEVEPQLDAALDRIAAHVARVPT